MDINRILTNIIRDLTLFNQSIENLEKIDSDEIYIQQLIKLITKFGNHPKLITLLIIKLQVASIDYQYNLELLDKLGLECLLNSSDSELLLEYYYYIDRVLQDSKSPESQKLIKIKLNSLLSNINEVITDKHN